MPWKVEFNSKPGIIEEIYKGRITIGYVNAREEKCLTIASEKEQ